MQHLHHRVERAAGRVEHDQALLVPVEMDEIVVHAGAIRAALAVGIGERALIDPEDHRRHALELGQRGRQRRRHFGAGAIGAMAVIGERGDAQRVVAGRLGDEGDARVGAVAAIVIFRDGVVLAGPVQARHRIEGR